MKIGIDCRLSGKKHAGIGRYIENLITQLPKVAAQKHSQIQWVYFFHDQKQLEATPGIEKLLSEYQIETVIAPIRHYTLQEQLRMGSVFAQHKLDLLHVPHFNVPIAYGWKFVITIHDLLWHQYQGLEVTTLPKTVYWFKYLGYRAVTRTAIHRAQAIITPSHTVKNEVEKHYPRATQKITVISEGVDQALLKAGSTTQPQSKHSDQLTLLFIGSLYPHKNISLVLEALKQAPHVQLRIAGSRSVWRDETEAKVAEMELQKQVTFLGYVPDEDLKNEIASASALVQPSLSEGFGLTGVEAMALGTPVLASNIPIFKEIYGDVAIYFDPKNADSFIQALDTLQSANKKELSSSGQHLSQKYSWEKAAQETLTFYTQALN